MLLVFPSQKGLVLVFSRKSRRTQGPLLPIHPRISPILPIDSAIEPEFVNHGINSGLGGYLNIEEITCRILRQITCDPQIDGPF